MANKSQVKQLWAQVQDILDSGKYQWIGESEPSDYFDWGMNYASAQDVIDVMIEEGDLE